MNSFLTNSSSEISAELSEKLISLSQKYESAEFLLKDPSQFMHRYTDGRTAEAVAFLAANLAFGRREQILSHVELILNAAGKSPVDWILSKKYEDFFPKNEHSFYRMYTNHDMRLFFDGLRLILEKHETIGDFFKEKWEICSKKKGIGNNSAAISSETNEVSEVEKSSMKNAVFSIPLQFGQSDSNLSFRASNASREIYLHQIISSAFPADCKLLPHSKDSAAKKVNMLLRWLVRTDSPVDLGLWTWFNKKDLLMPLDTHVMRQANELALIHSKSANLRTALALTKKVAEIFPDDPTKADFALFGLGVSLQ